MPLPRQLRRRESLKHLNLLELPRRPKPVSHLKLKRVELAALRLHPKRRLLPALNNNLKPLRLLCLRRPPIPTLPIILPSQTRLAQARIRPWLAVSILSVSTDEFCGLTGQLFRP